LITRILPLKTGKALQIITSKPLLMKIELYFTKEYDNL
jgi:hypothetical protein